MSSKYTLFAKFLLSVAPETFDLTLNFNEIERILKFNLPTSARTYLAWWAYEKNPQHPQKSVWQNAGWRVVNVDFSRKLVRFQRFNQPRIATSQLMPASSSRFKNPVRPESPDLQSTPFASQMALEIHGPVWETVFKLPQGTVLQKGRHGIYHELTQIAATYPFRFGCYAWANSTTVYYCGSFAADYSHGRFKTNLQARIHNYLQNHRIKDTGMKNTNLVVFEHLNEELPREAIYLNTYHFERMIFGTESIDFNRYCEDPDLVHLVESFLIAWYRRIGQCQWNRT